MRKTSTGGQTWPLTSPLAAPQYAAGGEIRFDMNDVPAKCPTGPLAYYVPAFILTLIGALVNAGEGPTPLNQYDLPGLILSSIEVRDVWHGTPISSSYWLGQHIRIHEFIGNGYSLAQRLKGDITPSAGPGTPVAVSVRIPLSAGEGELIRDTSQLALLYQPGAIGIIFKPATGAGTLDSISTGTTFVGSVRCSLELDPRAEIVLGAGIEHVLHRTVAAPSDPDIQIKGFGRSSKMTGVLPKGGVLTLMELTAAVPTQGAPMGGVFLGSEVNAFSFDWRGQKITKDVWGLINSMIGMIDHFPFVPVTGEDASNEYTVFPFTSEGANDGVATPLSNALLAWLMVLAGTSARLTDLQTADNDQTYHLDLGANTFDTGDHLIIARYARQWAQGKRDDFAAKMVKDGPNSLAAYVLGDGYDKAILRPRAPTDKHTLTADQTAYLPWQFV